MSLRKKLSDALMERFEEYRERVKYLCSFEGTERATVAAILTLAETVAMQRLPEGLFDEALGIKDEIEEYAEREENRVVDPFGYGDDEPPEDYFDEDSDAEDTDDGDSSDTYTEGEPD